MIIGYHLKGCGLAEFLVKRHRQVAIVEIADTLGEELLKGLQVLAPEVGTVGSPGSSLTPSLMVRA